MSAQQKEDRLFENIYLSYFPKMKRFAQEYGKRLRDATIVLQTRVFSFVIKKR